MALAAPAPRVLADVLPRSWVRDVLLIVGFAAFVGVTAQISVPLPWTPVLLTGQTFGVLLAGAALGSVRGMLSMLVYSVMGLVGVPWFASGSAGFSPSFGYIIGFIAAAGLVGLLAERGWTRTALDTALAMILGNVVIYACGVVWVKYALNWDWATAIANGMSPFLLGDGLKIALAAGLFPLVWSQLVKHGLAPRADGRDAQSDADSRVVLATAVTSDTDAADESSPSQDTTAEGADTVIDLTESGSGEESPETPERQDALDKSD